MTDENCGSANHPGDKASTTLCLLNERLLNSRIIRESIGDGFEEYLRLFDAFYANDVEVSSEANAHSIRGKANVRSSLYNFLLPVHVIVEVGGLSISIRKIAIPGGAAGELHSAWRLEFIGTTGTSCILSWHTFRKWSGSHVVYERHYDQRRTGASLTWRDLCMLDSYGSLQGWDSPHKLRVQ